METKADTLRKDASPAPGNTVKKERNSTLELLRIAAMLAVIAHHYVINSTVIDLFDYSHVTPQQYFLEIWGMWGKTAINSFILISGYFLCQMKLTWQRYFRLAFQIFFYGTAIMLIFSICGYEPLTSSLVIKNLFRPLNAINVSFSASFMVFYAFVPFYNVIIRNLNKKQLRWLVGGLLFVFTVTSTFFFSGSMNEPFWYMTLYFVAAYVRLYPNRYFENCRLWALVLTASVILSVLTVYIVVQSCGQTPVFIGRDMKMLRYHFVADSNKLLAFIVGFSSFMFFKNLKPFYNKTINLIAAGTFGVLLIHASSETMRRWLWQDVVGVANVFNAPMPVLVFHALITPLAIFAVCAFIDYFYRSYIEQPLMRVINRRMRKLDKIFPSF